MVVLRNKIYFQKNVLIFQGTAYRLKGRLLFLLTKLRTVLRNCFSFVRNVCVFLMKAIKCADSE